MHVYTEEETKAWLNSRPGKKSSACVCFVNSDGKVLMVKAHYKNEWTFPSGVVEAGESPKQTALREMNEETGIELNEKDVEFYSVIYTEENNGFRDRFNFVFRSYSQENSPQLKLQPEEIAEAKWVAFDEIATLANQRGSYIILQRLLENDAEAGSYHEVRFDHQTK